MFPSASHRARSASSGGRGAHKWDLAGQMEAGGDASAAAGGAHEFFQGLVNERDTLFYGPVMTESIMLPVVYGNKYRIRVAAVDAYEIQGPLSMWSLPYIPEPAPPGF